MKEIDTCKDKFSLKLQLRAGVYLHQIIENQGEKGINNYTYGFHIYLVFKSPDWI